MKHEKLPLSFAAPTKPEGSRENTSRPVWGFGKGFPREVTFGLRSEENWQVAKGKGRPAQGGKPVEPGKAAKDRRRET